MVPSSGARGYLLKGNVHGSIDHPRRACRQKRIPPICAELAIHAAEDQLTARSCGSHRAARSRDRRPAFSSGTAVKSHVGNILDKLGANDRTHAVTIGLKRGIIDL